MTPVPLLTLFAPMGMLVLEVTNPNNVRGGTLHAEARSASRVETQSSASRLKGISTLLSSSSMISLHRPGWIPPTTLNTNGPEHNWKVLMETSS